MVAALLADVFMDWRLPASMLLPVAPVEVSASIVPRLGRWWERNSPMNLVELSLKVAVQLCSLASWLQSATWITPGSCPRR